MAKLSRQGGYEFDEFRLDAAKLMLYRRGQEILLPPKIVETLLVLVENHGQIIAKSDLMESVWADSAVEESNLSQYLYLLRKTLGKQPDGKPYIETFRRRGYRFNGEVREPKVSSPAHTLATSPEVEQILTASNYDVERRGSVLKLVEWQEASIQMPEAFPAAETAAIFPAPKTSILKGAVIATLAILVLVSALFYLRREPASGREEQARAKTEMTFTRLTNGAMPVDAALSPNGDYFVYHEQDGATAHLWLQQTGQSNRLEIIPPSERIFGGKTFSPDGKFVYFIARDKSDVPPALYRVPTLGGVQSKISDDVYSAVSFSPDGKKMVFKRPDGQTGGTALLVADSGGGGEKVLLERAGSEGYLSYSAWSPDGGRIAFAEFDTQNVCRIKAIELETGAVKTLSPEKWDTCFRMAWTRDAAGLVFIGTKYGEGASTRRDQIYYLSVATGEARRLTTEGNRHQVSSLGISERDEILAVPFNRSSQIWQMSPSGEPHTAEQLTNGLADGRAGLAPMADGRLAYIASSGENLSVWLANTDGSDQKQITYDPPIVEEVRASADGKFLVFSAVRDGYGQLFMLDTDGANLRQLTFSEGNSIDSSISPDSNWIVYALGIITNGRSKHSLWKLPSVGADEPSLLTDVECFTPNYSPDGELVSCVTIENKILVISAENGALVKTFEPVKTPYFNIGARFSPDGRALVYIAERKRFSNLWRQPLEGGQPQPLTNFTSGEIYNFAFSPDGSRLYVARGYPIRDAVLIKNFR